MQVQVADAPDPATPLAIGAVIEDQIDGREGFGILSDLGFEAKVGDTRAVQDQDGRTIFVVGLGPAAKITPDVMRRAAAGLARAASQCVSLQVDVLRAVPGTCDATEALRALTEGLILGAYEYDRYKEGRIKLDDVTVIADGIDGGPVVADAVIVARAVTLTRDLVNEPGGSLTATRVGEIATELGEAHGFSVEVWDLERIRDERLGGLLGVNRGSSQAPRFVTLSYRPEGSGGTVALVGKGITFDSGGLSMKTIDGMIGMKGDMAAAAAVLGAFTTFRERGVSTAVTGYLPLTDNMVGPDATRVGDVLTIRNGTTVEVMNTDAEGRLILADALSLAVEDGPVALVDMATLTGSCVTALGHDLAGLMGNDQGLIDQVRDAAAKAGEGIWQLPLPESMRPQIDSLIADLKNVSSDKYGGALIAGLFLREFVPDTIPWAHIDMAGPGIGWPDGGKSSGGTGYGVRTLIHLVDALANGS